MTVGELKKKLDKIDDDAIVFLSSFVPVDMVEYTQQKNMEIIHDGEEDGEDCIILWP